MDFFFYGTLRDEAVLAAVLDGKMPSTASELAVLPGHRCVFVVGASYPALIADDAGQAVGLVVKGLNRAAVNRLDRFEGGDYRRQGLSVALRSGGTVRAQVYLPKPRLALSDRPWTLEEWQASADRMAFVRSRGA